MMTVSAKLLCNRSIIVSVVSMLLKGKDETEQKDGAICGE